MSEFARRVYLDFNATTPCDERVVAAMLPWFSQSFGNPSSSTHAWGQAAERAVEDARAAASSLLRVASRQTVFFSGATEALNFAVANLARRVDRLLVSKAEHAAVLEAARAVQGDVEVVWLDVDDQAHVVLAQAEQAMARGGRCAMAAMAANNEVGTIAHLDAIGELCSRFDAYHLCDAVQLAAWQPLPSGDQGRRIVVVSGHKLYGPKGVAALGATSAVDLRSFDPLIRGGKQEHGLRGGTLNVPAIVGLGAACRLAEQEREFWSKTVSALRDELQARLVTEVPGTHVNGDPQSRLPNNLHVSFDNTEADALMVCLPDVAVSTGSACHSGAVGPSHVIRAMGFDDDRAYGAVRLGLGRSTTADDVGYAAARVAAEVAKQRET